MDTSQVELLTTIGAHDPQIEAIASLFQAAPDRSDMSGSLYTESLMQVLLIYLLNYYCAFQPKIQHTEAMPSHRFQSVLDYIHSYLDQLLRLTKFAAIVGMSPYHFCRAFKQSIGVTPYQYVLQQRMEKAKGLLHQGKHSISEVPLLIGCTDQSRFARHFKKHFGVTPGLLKGRKLL